MKIVIHKLEDRKTIQEFADEHGLTLEVWPARDPLPRKDHQWHAGFRDTVTVLKFEGYRSFGLGDTHEEAINDYVRIISDGTIVLVGPGRDSDKKVYVPLLKRYETAEGC